MMALLKVVTMAALLAQWSAGAKETTTELHSADAMEQTRAVSLDMSWAVHLAESKAWHWVHWKVGAMESLRVQ